MTRRSLKFVLVAALTVLAGPAWAQQPARMPVVGILFTHATANDRILEYFRAGLHEYGYSEGRNIKLEIVTAAGQLDRLPELAQGMAHENVDVIITSNEASTRAARQASSIIPIVTTTNNGVRPCLLPPLPTPSPHDPSVAY